MRFSEWKALQKKTPPQPVHLIYDPHRVFTQDAKEFLLDRFVEQQTRPMNYQPVSLQDTPLAHILNLARTLPMMSPYRLLVVQDVGKLREADQASLETYLADPAPRTLLVFESGEMDRRSSLFKLFSRAAVVVEEDAVSERDLPREILSRAERAGFRMEPRAAECLVSFVGTDRLAIENELSKLMMNAEDSQEITFEAVEELVGRYRQRHIFDLVDAVGSRKLDLGLQILNRMLEDGENPIGILSMLARHFRQMLLVKEQGSRAKIYPSFLLDRLMAQARRHDREKIIQCIRQIAEADLQFKTSWVHPQWHLEMLLYRLNH